MFDTVIHGAKVLQGDRFEFANIGINGSVISAIDKGVLEGNHVISAVGKYIIPGLIDFHTHLDDTIGAFSLADDFQSGSKIAVMNGVTTICTFVTQKKNQSLHDAIKQENDKAKHSSWCDYHFHITPAVQNAETILALDELGRQGQVTLKFYTTYRHADLYQSYDALAKWMQELTSKKVRVLIHCEDDAIVMDPLRMQRNRVADRRPEIAEVTAVSQVLQLVATYEVPVHFVHVSTAEACQLIYQAKRALPVTMETCPQYLYLTATKQSGKTGYRYLCSPPMRKPKTKEALKRQFLEGKIDILATDHCAFTMEDKDSGMGDLDKTPYGIPGIGTLPHLCYRLFETEGHEAALSHLAEYCSKRPAQLLGLTGKKGSLSVGSDADLVIIDKATKPHSIMPTLRSCYNPYSKVSSRLTIHSVYHHGLAILENYKMNDNIKPLGEWVCQN